MDRCFGLLAGTLIICLVSFGCEPGGGGYKSAKEIKKEKGSTGHDDHEHGAGPHGGAIVELGDEEYHGEVVVDGKSHKLTVYLFGPDAKTPAPIAASEVTVVTEDDEKLMLKAVDAKEGKASQFALDDETKVEAIAKAGYLHGTLQLEAAGKPYRGDIDAHFDGSAHDDEKPADEQHEKPAKSDSTEKDEEPKSSDEGGKKDDAEKDGDAGESKDDPAESGDAGETTENPKPPALPE